MTATATAPLDPASPRGQQAERELNAVLGAVLARQEREARERQLLAAPAAEAARTA